MEGDMQDRYLVSYSPFRRLKLFEPLTEIDRFLDNIFPETRQQYLWPTTQRFIPYGFEEIKETEDSYVLSVPLPGMKEHDINIDLEGRMLRISANKNYEEIEQEEGVKYHIRRSGSVSYGRSMPLPEGVEKEDVEPLYKEGMLKVTIKKPEGLLQEQEKIDVKFE